MLVLPPPVLTRVLVEETLSSTLKDAVFAIVRTLLLALQTKSSLQTAVASALPDAKMEAPKMQIPVLATVLLLLLALLQRSSPLIAVALAHQAIVTLEPSIQLTALALAQPSTVDQTL